jgi:replication fork protection complex subunit Tof1/Swi1
VLGDDALACLRDLKKWLKLYDEKLNRLDVARCLAEAKLVGGDILPILASWTEDGKNDRVKSRVALACLELLVPLTWPLETAGEMTVNHHRHTPYLQQAQVLYKAGILSWDNCSILRQIVRIGLPSIALPRDERTSRDDGIIKLVLYFLRNVAVIRQIPNLPDQGLDMVVSRSATIDAFVEQDVFALLLTMCSNIGDDFNLQDVVLLEILFNLVKGIDVSKLWLTKLQRADANISELTASLATEKAMERANKKTAPSRHNRFGTMIWVKREDHKTTALSGQENVLENKALFNMDKSKKWNKPKTKDKDMQHTIHDFNRFEDLTDSATEQLRNFVEEFLDSGFNPLFTHLRKAIEREADRLLDVNYRQFFYCVSWFLEAERTRRTKNKNEKHPANLAQANFEAESYSLVAAVLNQETFILLNRYMQNALDSKEWQDLNACMRCFTQILLTVQEMAASPLEDDQEIAENIQNRIFYEETTHDRIVGILRGYKDQGFGYLDACTELSHTFLRMLERYSKENADLQVRSKRRARQKKKDAQKEQEPQGDEQIDEDDSEREDMQEAVKVSKERKFDFNRFANKFCTQQSINTFVAFLNYYKELNNEQLKRAHRFFYRAAFKQDSAVLLYRVDIIALFYRTVTGPDALSPAVPMTKEWTEFTKQLFKKLTRKLDERPELLVEMLFSKINSTTFYLEYGHDKQTSSAVRAPAELEIRPSLNRDVKEQIGILVTILLKDDKLNLVLWLKDTLVKASDERLAWGNFNEARKAAAAPESSDPATPATAAAPEVNLAAPLAVTARPTTDEIRTAMFKNARLRLLMKLCGLQLLGDEDVLGAPWIIPGSVTGSQLKQFVEVIETYEFRPWQSENADEEPEDLLRRVPKPAGEVARDGFIDDGEARRDAFLDDSEGEEEFEFPDNIRKPNKKKDNALEELKRRRRKRKRDTEGEEGDEVDDDAAAARRKARQDANDERRRKIKSELYVHDSDDESDAEADKEFFRKEEAVRKRQEENIRRQMAVGVAAAGDEKGGRKKGKNGKVPAIGEKDLLGEDGDLMDLDGEDEPQRTSPEDDDEEETAESSQPAKDDPLSDDEAGADTETPLSSQSEQDRSPPPARKALEEMRQPRATARNVNVKKAAALVEDDEDVDAAGEEDDDDEPRPTAVRMAGRRRGGFIVDSDDDE